MTWYYTDRDHKNLADRVKLRERLATEPKQEGETDVERINRIWKTIQDTART